MKLAFVSDFHLGYNDDALEQARAGLRKAKEVADAIICPGDLFDTRVPKQEVLHDSIKLFSEFQGCNAVKVSVITNEGITQTFNAPLAIYGNHDRRAKGLSNPLHLLDSAQLALNFHTKKILLEKDGERVVIQGLGGLPDSMAKEALKLVDFKPEKNAFNVFVFHQSVYEVAPVDETFLSINDLPAGFDLYVDGHIHWPNQLNQGGRMLLLPGSTVVTQLKEKESEGKGFYLYDTLAKTFEFIKIKPRPFYFKQLQFSNASISQVEEQVRREAGHFASISAKPPLIKLKLRGTLSNGLPASSLDLSAIEKEFADKAVLSIDKEFDGASDLKEKIEFLRKLQSEKKSVRELGAEILRQKMSSTNSAIKGREEQFFELLAEAKVEDALAQL